MFVDEQPCWQKTLRKYQPFFAVNDDLGLLCLYFVECIAFRYGRSKESYTRKGLETLFYFICPIKQFCFSF